MKKAASIVLAVVGLAGLALWVADGSGTIDLPSLGSTASVVGSHTKEVDGAGASGKLAARRLTDRSASGVREERFAWLENAMSLAASPHPGKVDYALMVAPVNCLALVLSDRQVAERFELVKSLNESGNPFYGRVDPLAQLAAKRRAEDRCRIIFPDGRMLSDDARAAAKRSNTPAWSRLFAVRDALEESADPSKMGEALRVAVAEPVFSAIRSLVANRRDFSGLFEAYPPDTHEALHALATQLVTCRFGDDCGPAGTVTLQLCWFNALCGRDAESAIYANMVAQGLDPAAMQRFVAATYDGLQRTDTTLFRPPKPKAASSDAGQVRRP
ncbi:MAG TPA: hypothetical protein PLD37_02230 [Usitatibacteraceae bacterium]|nr:hypothetical protein [Usitatibacteraceae bacterium]